ncbi:uncharacterized protein DEA37_0002855 [Paragonimus westermani]|uniref:Uncharacterized protein n=1 Tax=Paragonimus westermani TaxID=34504 RepID=A0A5J4P3W1_9TREM|nr:uncharacterized protein DEA37_0002855 [Paragonimus westermani]
MDSLEAGDISSVMGNLRAQMEAVWREEARVFLRNVMQEEKYRLDELLSTRTKKSTSDAIPFTPAPIKPRMHQPASMVSRTAVLAVHNQKTKRSSPIESIVRKEAKLIEIKQEKPVECMPQVQFQKVFNQLVSHIGSRAQVYTIISAALGRDPQALGLINNILGNRLVRNSFFKTVRSPTYLFDFLATLLGSRTELRVTLSDIIDGNVDAFDRLACWVDSDAALFNMIQCYKDACREAQMIVQSYLPVSRSSSSIVDMLIDGNRSEESIAELINGVSYNMTGPMPEQILGNSLQVAPETLRLISTALVSCDYKRLQEMKSAKITPIDHQEREKVIREKASDSRSPMNEVTQGRAELRVLLASNSLVKDTLDELYTNSQTALLEPTVYDYISLVNKGEFLGGQALGSSRAADYAIEHFSALTEHLRNVVTWSVVKDPVHHDLCIAKFEHTVRHALTVSQKIARHIEGFMGGAAKLKNVPDLLQRAVNGDTEANQELMCLLGQGKGSFLLSSVQQAQGQVVDRILRHCATETQIEEIEAMLQQTQSEDNCEAIKRLIDGWIRLFKNASKLAVKLGVSDKIKKTKSLLLTKDVQRLISGLSGKLEIKHVPDDIVPVTAAESDVIHGSAINVAAIPAKTKYSTPVKRKLLFKQTSSTRGSATDDMEGEAHVQTGKPKSFQITDVMLPDPVLPDSIESVTDRDGTGKATDQRAWISDQMFSTSKSGSYMDVVTIPVSRRKSEPVKGSFEMVAKRPNCECEVGCKRFMVPCM